MKLPKPKDYPKEIYVRDEIYTIKMVKVVDEKDPDCFGLCDDEKKLILIRENQSPRGLFRTFIHETIHALEKEWKVKIKHEQVHLLEAAIDALIMDNF